MASDQERLDLLTICALDDGEKDKADWSLIAREAQRDQGVSRLLSGQVVERSSAGDKARSALARQLDHGGLDAARERVHTELDAAARVGARLVTVLDQDYPTNLRLISNLPPFLFVLGDEFRDVDLKSVAVVGTRQPSAAGVRRAQRMARELVARDVTVVSGLAAGVDTAAHTTTLECGGRTIAVIGTGITKVYPKENRGLSDQIAKRGIVVSQFWPTSGPARWTFPRRNVVMSGIAQGTVVIEAGSTSGAKMQARFALEHGKRVFLPASLVDSQPWAKKYAEQRGAVVVAEVADVLDRLAEPARILSSTGQRQMAFDLD